MALSRILLLEDSPLDADLSMARLRKSELHLEVVHARNRDEFMHQIENHKFDMILADYSLPDFDALSALTHARAKHPRIPFIIVSGVVGEEVAVETLQRGATDYVLKHRMERLVPAVTRALHEAEQFEASQRAEAKARKSEDRFRKLTNALPQMIWTIAADGKIAYTNDSWKRSVADDITDWCDPRLIDREDLHVCHEAWKTAQRDGRPFAIECRFIVGRERISRWQLVRVVPLDDAAHGEAGWVGTATDLQDQKLNQDALRTAEKLALTGRLAATIAHEINNPLESIMNLIFLVRQESLSPKAADYLEMAENELTRISSISKQTLQFYRDPSTASDVVAREIVEEVTKLFQSRCSAKNVTIVANVPQEIVFRAVKGEIRQALINLVNNAIDAVPLHGHVWLSACRVIQNGESMVRIMVEDDGPGVTAEQASKLFQPFFSTKGSHGTGLGLWVSKGIVEKHRGSIEFTRERRNGKQRTVVSLTVPEMYQDSEESFQGNDRPMPAAS